MASPLSDGSYYMSLKERYDSFQRPAVDSIVNDFKLKPTGRYLLVIPTGGGKTITAVKAICKMFETGFLDKSSEKILWVAHRNELLEQAKTAFEEILNDWPGTPPIELAQNVELMMRNPENISEALSDKAIKLAVIDEAHHSAASSYQPIMNNHLIGVLGLTATPSRHDGRPLEFDHESFAIGFPDLIKKGIILRPTIRRIKGETYEITPSMSTTELEQFNNKKRNKKIIDEIKAHHCDYKKVIIFAATVKHAEDLHSQLKDSEVNELYSNIDVIFGNQFSALEQRKEFIKRQKLVERSIIVNVDILTEGYDDPSVNTVIMARPTKSKLLYMQAVGRAVRMNKDDELKKAFIVEITDELPNIRYPIDNRWLFSDMSDVLEPAVEDLIFYDEETYNAQISKILDQFSIEPNSIDIPPYSVSERVDLLLFNQYQSPGKYKALAVFVTKVSCLAVRQTFNFISQRITELLNTNTQQVFNMVGDRGYSFTSHEQRHVFDAMKNAYQLVDGNRPADDWVSKGGPWITYVTFRFEAKESQIDPNLVEFLTDVANKETIIGRFRARDYEAGDILIKLPLQLAGCIALIISGKEFRAVKSIVDKLKLIKNEPLRDNYIEVDQIIQEADFPLPKRYANSLSLLVRDEIKFSYPLGN